MAKKKFKEDETVEAANTVAPIVDASTADARHEAPLPTKQASTLMDEVQAFLAQREELASKLAAEIEATEKKLSELKATAALLFPENAEAPAKDKKAKKVSKPKRVVRDEPAADDIVETEEAA